MSTSVEDLLLSGDPLSEGRALGERVKTAADVTMKPLTLWNYEPCQHHEKPEVACEYRMCGGDLFSYQRVGLTWLYMVRKGMLADSTGLGKTLHGMGLYALLKERDELRRGLVVCQSAAVDQWAAEFARFVPSLNVIRANAPKAQRLQRYRSPWDVAVISYQTLLRDEKVLQEFRPNSVFVDDVDPARNHDTKTHRCVRRFTDKAERVVVANATPLQIRLQELHAMSLLVGGLNVFGGLTAFENRFVRIEWVRQEVGKGHKRRVVTKKEVVGYKRMEEFKAKIGPLYLRRTYDDVDHIVTIPKVMPPENIWLELSPQQRARYKELQAGVLRLQKEGEAEKITHVEAFAQVTHAAQICSSLSSLGEADSVGNSTKMDWFMEKLATDWTNSKIVVFSRFKGTIRVLHERCAEQGIGVALITGDQSGPGVRAAQIKKFWEDPNCRVIVGTTAIERSLNLQNANIVVNYDTLLNPARMLQILGRARRVGSSHKRVYVFNLLHKDTHEERALPVLQRRQAVSDYVFGDDPVLYEALSPMEMLQLIRP